MSKVGEFDSDSDALESRIALQERYGNFDLIAWILENLNAREGMRCLDLGCGHGAQTLPIANMLGESGKVTAFDISNESLMVLQAEAVRLGIQGRVNTIHAPLDSLSEALDGQSFHRVVGSYSLYYVDDADKLFHTIYDMLLPGGVFFLCGPAFNNNIELRRLVADASGETSPLSDTAPSIFMEETAQHLAHKIFDVVSVSRFQNPIVYPKPNDVIQYWRNHNLFDAALENQFVRVVQNQFVNDGSFENSKRGIGIKAVKSS